MAKSCHIALAGAAFLAVVASGTSCKTLLDCCGSPCVSGACGPCNVGYTGPSCCALDLDVCDIAVNPNETWSWGAAPRWTNTSHEASVEVHAMGLRNHCGINNYRYNAFIQRGLASSFRGPFSMDRPDEGQSFMPGLPPRFDGTEVEDPNIVELPNKGGTLLFYTGAWVHNDSALNCTERNQPQPDSGKLALAQRAAVAYRPYGSMEWQRQDTPILMPRPFKFDEGRTTNPAALVFPNGSVLVAYRGSPINNQKKCPSCPPCQSVRGMHPSVDCNSDGVGCMCIRGGVGIAIAPHWSGPYEPLNDVPLFTGYVEDPTLFLGTEDPPLVHMIGHGELQPRPKFNVGIHAVSADGGRTWSDTQIAYTLSANWSSSVLPTPLLGRREAPQILLSNDGKRQPVALYNAAMPCNCTYGDHRVECSWGNSCRSFSMVCAFKGNAESLELLV